MSPSSTHLTSPTSPTHPKSALLLIDIQNDFLPPSGTLAVPHGTEIIDRVLGLLGASASASATVDEEGEGKGEEKGEGDEWLEKGWDWVVASQDWHPRTHISFSSHHKHPHVARPYTTVKVPRGVLGEYYEISVGGERHRDEDQDEDEGAGAGSASGSSGAGGGGGGGGDPKRTRESQAEPTSDGQRLDGQELDDPLRRFKVAEGVDDGQVDLNLWPDHCVQNTYGAELHKDLKVALRPWYQAGKFALVRKITQGTQLDREAFSAFSGHVLSSTSPEIRSALGMERDGPVDSGGQAQDSENEKEEDDLARFLIGLGVDRVCVVGLAMDYCVAQTALAALNKPSNPFSVYIYTPAVKGVGEETTRTALRVCKDRGIGMLNTEDELREVFGKRRM